jgi:F-type H+-transporting ATPase subunit a
MHYERPLVTFLNLTFDLSLILTSTVTALIVFLFAIFSTRKLATSTPKKWQNVMEWLVEFVQNIMMNTIGIKDNMFILTTGVALFLFILVSNLLGIPFSIVTDAETTISWWKSPTSDAHVTMTLAIMMIAYTHFIDFRLHGFKKYFLGYFKPFKLLFPINLLEQFATTLTLGLRLFGNVYAGEVMLALLAAAVNNGVFTAIFASIPMVIWQAFCIFIGALQAYIFVTLTMVYIGQRITAH